MCLFTRVERVAKIEKWYKCPVCKRCYTEQREAVRCKNKHPILEEEWAVSEPYTGKAVKICMEFSREMALREADLPDNIVERKKKLCELENEKVKTVDRGTERCEKQGAGSVKGMQR